METRIRLDEILQRLRATERELQQELDLLLTQKRRQFRYQLHRGKVVFEQGIKHLQKQHRTGIWRFLQQAPIAYVLTAPVIYAMVIPLAILDITITLYQQICFRVYKIPRVRRSNYLVIDRHQLAYLNAIEKFNCVYCSYGNGLIEYAREITARTEQYWCPIKHAKRTLDPHHRSDRFLDYGDARAYRAGLEALRNDWSGD